MVCSSPRRHSAAVQEQFQRVGGPEALTPLPVRPGLASTDCCQGGSCSRCPLALEGGASQMAFVLLPLSPRGVDVAAGQLGPLT